MPAPLAMPLIVTLALPILTVAVATFGKVSVVMIALGGVHPAARRGGLRQLFRARRRTCVASSGSPITPVEARNTSSGLQPIALAAIVGGQRGRLPAGLAGEGVGVAGIDHQRARGAALQLVAAPFDRRRRALRLGEHAGDRRCPGPAPPAARRCGPCSGCRPRRWRGGRRRSPAAWERWSARAGKRTVDIGALSAGSSDSRRREPHPCLTSAWH